MTAGSPHLHPTLELSLSMKRSKPTVAALLAAGGLFVATGAGALAVTLPDHASSTATDKVAELETGTPADAQAKADDTSADDEATETDTDADEAKAADSTDDETEKTDDAEDARPDTHGAEVSQLATTTELEGAEKGKAVSTLAKTNSTAKRGDHADDDEDEDEAKAGAETESHHDESADAGEDD
jgi:hypothetical protein